jgi:hypothetical protein
MPTEEQTHRQDIEQNFDRFDRGVRRSLLRIELRAPSKRTEPQSPSTGACMTFCAKTHRPKRTPLKA